MIRIDAMWLAVEPIDMRAGMDRLLARVVQVFGAAHAHHGYLFANVRGTRVKLLVHDGFGVWCAARRLNTGRFAWQQANSTSAASLSHCLRRGPYIIGVIADADLESRWDAWTLTAISSRRL